MRIHKPGNIVMREAAGERTLDEAQAFKVLDGISIVVVSTPYPARPL
jgi:hypothetical protein